MTTDSAEDLQSYSPPLPLPHDGCPLISILVVVRNSMHTIDECLASIFRQLPNGQEHAELLLVDSASTDGTARRLAHLANQSPFRTKLAYNPLAYLSAGWNVGIRLAQGTFLLRVDAHATIAPDYVERGLAHITASMQHSADPIVVGGAIRTVGEGTFAETVAAIREHPFGVGPSPFRLPSPTVRTVDTAVYAIYPRQLLIRAGMLNEAMRRGEDLELHARLRRMGVRFVQDPRMKASHAAPSHFLVFLKKSFGDGYWGARGLGVRVRHLPPLLLLLTSLLTLSTFLAVSPNFMLLSPLAAYGLGALLSAVHLCLKTRNVPTFLLAPFLFSSLHFTRGLGLAAGFLSVAIGRATRLAHAEQPQ